MKDVLASVGAALFTGSEVFALGVGVDGLLFLDDPAVFGITLWVVGALSVASALWAASFAWKGEQRLKREASGS